MFGYYGIALDFIVILAFISFWISGFKKGMIRSLLYFIGSAISIFIMSISAKYIANLFFDFFLKDFLLKIIETSILNKDTSKMFMNNFPWFIKIIFNIYKVEENSFLGILTDKNNALIKIADLISPKIINALTIICSGLIYITVTTLIRITTRFLVRLFNFPILSGINRFLGGAFGLCKGFCVILCAVYCLKIAMPNFKKTTILSEKNINSSILFKNIYNFDGRKYLSKIIKF
ncbi:MAG: CvpA family protein [Candidatus Improbicoccus pseudotrichonymphae]|uniref:CvpA family protein n=1 Tax=Candidatus Improbicoccus pseudotrichonymphae TaxID=3033792 RepID=A0AA48KZ62_9FIRM|nr:MAG: CvpA family protein [Candidatus Improbicoccus pseudotrichonymphae]